jgi:hypothetical protein
MTVERVYPPVVHVTEIVLRDPRGVQVGEERTHGQLPVLHEGDFLELHGAEFRIQRVPMKVVPGRPDHGEPAEATLRYEAVRLTD